MKLSFSIKQGQYLKTACVDLNHSRPEVTFKQIGDDLELLTISFYSHENPSQFVSYSPSDFVYPSECIDLVKLIAYRYLSPTVVVKAMEQVEDLN